MRAASRPSIPSLLLLAACAYLMLVGARTDQCAPVVTAEQLGLAIQADDSDTDDDSMSAQAAIHFASSLDSGAVDLQCTPELPYRPEVARFAAALESGSSRLDIRELFRPPRTVLL